MPLLMRQACGLISLRQSSSASTCLINRPPSCNQCLNSWEFGSRASRFAFEEPLSCQQVRHRNLAKRVIDVLEVEIAIRRAEAIVDRSSRLGNEFVRPGIAHDCTFGGGGDESWESDWCDAEPLSVAR